MTERARVLLALSGGMDSAVSAYLLKERGYRVEAVTFRLFDSPSYEARLEDCRKVARFLNIPLLVLDLREDFRKLIMDYFASEYRAGRTPNPCAFCNWRIKFTTLANLAGDRGAEYIATGHYARIVWHEGEPFLAPAVDRKKSQEYFLSFLSPDLLRRTIFPLAEMTKERVRELAEEIELPVKSKKESQDVCFLEGSRYTDFLMREYGFRSERGEIVDRMGRVLGHHRGYFFFTVGQRRGLRVRAGYPLYVTELDPSRNRVVVGRREEVFKRFLRVKLLQWRTRERELMVRIRYRHTPARAKVEKKGKSAEVLFEAPQFAPTPGQIAVFYNNQELVVGAGIIEEVIS